MGNEYNRFNHHHHHRHHHHQHHNLQMHHRSTFLPMLCSKPSIKDVRLPNYEDRSASFKEDPLSPRISCMGQVKRSNKVNGFPTSHRLTISNSKNNSPNSHNHHHNSKNFKYSKLKKLFSSKNLTATAISTATITTTSTTTTRCRSRGQVIVNASSGPRVHDDDDHSVTNINLVDLDPPLPVIKRVHKPDSQEEEVVDSLWKRRSGGAALKGLQLKQIHHPRHQNQPTTV